MWNINFVDKVFCGKKNILTAKDPYQIGVTSGTSGKSCLLPTTNDVNRTFLTSGVFVAIKSMFEAYPEVHCMNIVWYINLLRGDKEKFNHFQK